MIGLFCHFFAFWYCHCRWMHFFLEHSSHQLNILHIRGTDNLTERDVLSLFRDLAPLRAGKPPYRPSFDWLIDLTVSCFIVWSYGCPLDWLIDCLIDIRIPLLIDWLIWFKFNIKFLILTSRAFFLKIGASFCSTELRTNFSTAFNIE